MSKQKIEIKPGQVWLCRNKYGYDGDMVYVMKSKEPDEEWEMICFQEWDMGGDLIKGTHTEDDIRERFEYVGHIDFFNTSYIGD